MDPQLLQLAQMLGINPQILASPQGQQMLQLLVSKLGAAAPQGAPGAQGAVPAPMGAPGAAPAGPGPQQMAMLQALKGAPAMAGGNPGADAMRRTDPYSMMQ